MSNPQPKRIILHNTNQPTQSPSPAKVSTASATKKPDKKKQKRAGTPSKHPISHAADADEWQGPYDPIGETKIDESGNLLGGRQWRVRTFVLPRHPTRLYMFTIDVSKVLNFRDSFIFHARNKEFPKVLASESDKEELDRQGLIISQMKTRNINIIPARSVFKKFGHKFVKHGRPVRDDYLVGDQVEPEGLDDMVLSNDEAEELVPVGFKRNPAKNRDEQMGLNFAYTMNLARTQESIEKLTKAGLTELAVKSMPDHEYVDRLNMLVLGIPQDQYHDNARMLRCVSSAHHFNKNVTQVRNIREDYGGFLDLHTGMIHQRKIPEVEFNIQVKDGPNTIEKHVVAKDDDKEWHDWGGQFNQVNLYPLALYPEQYQAIPNLQRGKFVGNDSRKRLREYEAVIGQEWTGSVKAPKISIVPVSLEKPQDGIFTQQVWQHPVKDLPKVDLDSPLPRSKLNHAIVQKKITHEAVSHVPMIYGQAGPTSAVATLASYVAMSADDPRFKEEMAKLDGMWFCAFTKTRTGLPCKRPVTKKHELCMYHADQKDNRRGKAVNILFPDDYEFSQAVVREVLVSDVLQKTTAQLRKSEPVQTWMAFQALVARRDGKSLDGIFLNLPPEILAGQPPIFPKL